MDFCTLDTNNCNSGYSPSYGLPACSCSCVKSEQGGEYQPQGEPEVSVTEKSCEDSDGGKNYDKQGIVTITEKDLSEDYKEKCLTSNYLREYYCKENNTLGYENHYCGDEYSCEDGRCIRCEPNCVGKDCGSDGCGSTCGSCSASEYCVSGKCVCVPDCSGKECGPDGCGGNCGICASNYKCEEGICVKEEQKRLCVDSDGGMEYDVGGKVVLSSGKEYTDYCLIGRILKEYYCKEGNLRYTYHFCEGGCGDGACGSGTQVARFTITGHAVKDMNENRGFFERIFEAALVFFS
jgi:hypothetical protein